MLSLPCTPTHTRARVYTLPLTHLQDTFTFSCTGWVDLDLPLMYQYLISVVPSDSGSNGLSLAESTVATEIPLADPGTSQQMETSLGGGGGGGDGVGRAMVGVAYVSVCRTSKLADVV